MNFELESSGDREVMEGGEGVVTRGSGVESIQEV